MTVLRDVDKIFIMVVQDQARIFAVHMVGASHVAAAVSTTETSILEEDAAVIPITTADAAVRTITTASTLKRPSVKDVAATGINYANGGRGRGNAYYSGRENKYSGRGQGQG